MKITSPIDSKESERNLIKYQSHVPLSCGRNFCEDPNSRRLATTDRVGANGVFKIESCFSLATNDFSERRSFNFKLAINLHR